MRILHVDPDAEWRGGQRQVLLLAAELHRRGHETSVACHPEGVLGKRVRAAGVATEPLGMRGDLDPAATARTARLVSRFRPDVLHLHSARAHAVGGLAARMLGFRPVLVTRRLELPVRGAVLGRWKYRALADHYVAISRAVEESLVRGGVARERVTRIPSGVELPRERAAPAARQDWTVGTLGAFTPQKDPSTWLRTVERVCREDPGIRFVWAGSGELRASVEVAIRRAGIADRVELPGHVDPETVWPRIDALFLPSAFEALGTVILDAMARGLPVVATEVGGIPETARHDREALLAARGDAEELSAHLLSLRRDPALARRLGDAGRERATEYEIGGIVDRIVELYERLLETKGGRS